MAELAAPMASAARGYLGLSPGLAHHRKGDALDALSSFCVGRLRPRPNPLSLRIPPSRPLRRKPFPKCRPFLPTMEWQDCGSEIEIAVPCSVAYDCYSDCEAIPKWMPFISSVKLTVSYEIPEIMIPVAAVIQPFMEGLLEQGLQRFAIVVKEYQRKISQR
ncbi:hypothetical protein ZIOFF_001302 [Zingiber officinale]|uniref:Coenzyme Q-binding protein COQ10 START domain-containing protein n=1 Tax=Zingiber officinale TaxID=94328 RepID=A0A8J5LYC9_ZINOF|nr:hypothetical protein ZIOFF_001302 [Zingiber officinale]